MKVTKVKGWKCPECEVITLVDELPPPEVEDFFQCGECDEVYGEKDEARECCKD